MKKLLLSLPVLAVLAVVMSCQFTSSNQRLHDVDMLLVSRPDSALARLRAMADTMATASRADRMYYQLLLADAQNKCYVDFTTDSVMKQVAAYYDRHGTTLDRIRAHYLLGCTYRDLGEAPQALQCYQDAVELADTTSTDCDFRLLSRVYGQMGTLFRREFLLRQALHANQLSSRYAWKAKDTLNAVLAYGQNSSLYYALNNMDSALVVFHETYDKLKNYGYASYANTFLSIPISILLSEKRNDEAKEYIDLYEHQSIVSQTASSGIENFHLLYYYKGCYLAGMGKPDSAAYYYRKAASSHKLNNQGLAYSALYALYKDSGLKDSLAKYIELYRANLDTLSQTIENSRLQQIQGLCNYNRHQQIAAQETSRANTLRFWLVVALACLAIMVLVWLSAWLLYKYLKAENRNSRFGQTTEFALKALAHQILKSELEKSERQKEQLADQCNRLRHEMETTKSERDDAKEAFETISSQYKAATEELERATKNYDAIKDDYEKTKMILTQKNQDKTEDWGLEDAILSLPLVERFHELASHSKSIPSENWEELDGQLRQLMPNFMVWLDQFNMRKGSKGYKLCILTRLQFELSEICSLLSMTSQALNLMRRRLHTQLFGGSGSAPDFDAQIRSIPR